MCIQTFPRLAARKMCSLTMEDWSHWSGDEEGEAAMREAEAEAAAEAVAAAAAAPLSPAPTSCPWHASLAQRIQLLEAHPAAALPYLNRCAAHGQLHL